MSIKVLPPANGKKLWRVKKLSSPIEPSNECFNNSLRISQGEKFTVKRPPLRRPKNRPGKPKDFVFVDLSPIKVEQEKQTPQQLPSPALSFELPMDSFSDNDSMFDSKMLDDMEPIGLGISLDYNWDQMNYTSDNSNPTTTASNNDFNEYPNPNQYELKLFETEQVLLQQNQQIQQLQQQLNQFQQQMQPPVVHKRAKSLDLKKKNQIQFKTYTGPKKKSKRSVSESIINTAQINQLNQLDQLNQVNQNNQLNTYNTATNSTNTQNLQQSSSTGLEDYIVFNQLLNSGSFTPITDYSDEEEFKSQDLNLNLNLDFDYNFNI